MKVSKYTHLDQCGEGCKALDVDGVDLIEKYYVQWVDEENGEIGVYSWEGEPLLQSKGSSFQVDVDWKTGAAKVLTLSVLGLRFIPATRREKETLSQAASSTPARRCASKSAAATKSAATRT